MDHSLLITMIEINVSMPDRLLKIESCQPVEEIYCQNDIPVGLLMKSRMDPFRKMFMWAPFVYLLSAVKKILPYQYLFSMTVQTYFEFLSGIFTEFVTGHKAICSFSNFFGVKYS